MNAPKKTSDVVAKTLKYLTSAEGQETLQKAASASRKAVEPFRKARIVASERLNRRFTV